MLISSKKLFQHLLKNKYSQKIVHRELLVQRRIFLSKPFKIVASLVFPHPKDLAESTIASNSQSM